MVFGAALDVASMKVLHMTANSQNSKNNAGSNVSHIKAALSRAPDVVGFNEEKQEGAGFTKRC